MITACAVLSRGFVRTILQKICPIILPEDTRPILAAGKCFAPTQLHQISVDVSPGALMLLPISEWGYAEGLFENAMEVRKILKAGFERNGDDGLTGLREQITCVS